MRVGRVLFAQITAICFLLIGLGLFGLERSFLRDVMIGGGLITLDLAVLLWACRLLFLKKFIALAAGVIVFKWPIVGYALYKIHYWLGFEYIGVSFGVGTIAVMPFVYLALDGLDARAG